MSVFLVAGLSGVAFPAQRLADKDFEAIPLLSPNVTEQFGIPIFYPAQGRDDAKIITPGKKHLEIDKSVQRLLAYDELGRLVLESPVSTGRPGIDEKGRRRSETRSGLYRVSEVKRFKRWSKDPRVKMLNWIGLTPGIEKGMHTLNPVGEFANFENLLGEKASHGCIRLNRETSHWLIKWIAEEWKMYPLIVYIYDHPIGKETVLQESRYLLFPILREGIYTYDFVSHEKVPSIQRNGTVPRLWMSWGSFLLYKKEDETWHLIRYSDGGGRDR